MKINDLKKHIEGGGLKKAYLVTGADEYLKRSAVTRFTALAGACPDFNLAVFKENYTAQQLFESLCALPLLGGVRVVIAYGCTFDLAPLTHYFSSLDGDRAVLVLVGELTPNLSVLLKSGAIEAVDCGRLPDALLLNWIAVRSRDAGAAITADAAKMLIAACGGMLTRISVELQKLADYKAGGEIASADVESLVAFDAEHKIYELGDAVAAGNAKKAETILHALFESNMPAAGTLGYLYKHFRRLLFIRLHPDSDTLSSDLGIAEYAVKMSLRQAQRLPVRKLKAAVDELHDLNTDFRAGKITDKNALVLFVFKAVHSLTA